MDDNCFLPDCQCFTTKNPADLSSGGKLPQIVVISFDDAVTVSNFDFYNYISQFSNPNSCPISMTFFVSHQYNDYSLVNDLHRRGHEIAVHSVT